MEAPRRRYFIAEGPDALLVKDKVLAAQKLHQALHREVMNKYKCFALFTSNSQNIVGLAYKRGHVAPVGCKLFQTAHHEGERLDVYKPLLNRKAGKLIDKDFKLAGGFSGSDLIIQAFGCNNMVASIESHALWVAVAGIVKDTIVVNIPEDDNTPAKVHACFREIKKSEFIAFTEE